MDEEDEHEEEGEDDEEKFYDLPEDAFVDDPDPFDEEMFQEGGKDEDEEDDGERVEDINRVTRLPPILSRRRGRRGTPKFRRLRPLRSAVR